MAATGSDSTDDTSARRLAEVVVARMGALHRSRRRVHLRGGPTEPTLLKIERGEARGLTPKTLRRLDIGLDWTAGSAENVYFAGGNPTPLKERTGIVTGPPGVYVDAETITELITAAHEIGDLAESESPSMRAAARRLDATIQPLYARFVTQLLEANRRQGGALGPLVAILGPYLDRTIDPARDNEEEARYRRWLAGMRVELDESTRRRFETRLTEASA
ncbi:XRE family transcriptional regulator [Nocardia uniformis]|uniref:XRE family transcriptional regulator n=1 Tax=Nocardia uniformis TaxID=53432 RepID=A0A849C0D9_9NOCA|nr:hypothetical protein [Nocardia uniformis]NNH69337.1 XRE family transcriptional regulator [Nocardia uniformis]